MKIPDYLSKRIDHCLQEMLNHPEHQLGLGLRHTIYAALGDTYPSHPLEPKGQVRRTYLALNSVKLVLSKWEAVFPTNYVPHKYIEMAENILNGNKNTNAIRTNLSAYWSKMDSFSNELPDGINFYNFYVGYGAVRLLTVALYDEKYDPDNLILTLTEDCIDVFDWDTASLVLLAYCEADHFATINAEKRKTFWEWWLKHAVIEAWGSVP